MIVAAVPIKNLIDAKQRLASVLTLAERDLLARAMLRDVLRALAAAELDRIWVVTREPAQIIYWSIASRARRFTCTGHWLIFATSERPRG